MKKYLLVTIMLVTALAGFGQKVRLSGKLVNAKPQMLALMSFTGFFKDSILLNADGTFSYETDQVRTPFRGAITNMKDVHIQLFLAPGFDMQINFDTKDPRNLHAGMRYSGVGAKTNAYSADVLKALKADTVNWDTKDTDTYINHVLEQNKIITAIIEKDFDSSNDDPYRDYFRQSLLTDLKYDAVNNLFGQYACQHKLSWQQLTAMSVRLGVTDLEKELNQDKNLSGLAFSFLVSNYPLYCHIYNAFPADEQLKKDGNYQLYLASGFYTGKVYDFVVQKLIGYALDDTFKLDHFEKLQVYTDKINDPQIKELIKKSISARIKETSALKLGTPSPLFNLPDTSGKMHQLPAFKGKVVYIDLWASWCGPCKQETPFLKNIADHYKDDNRIKIISIACWDAKNRKSRYELIKRDQMDWLQLEDTYDSFANAYQVKSIPRFIIIDKQGNIADSDAPRPSNKEKLIAVLDKEINR